ncbi:uncharacterized protein FRV6_14449 [Fusarium oxysporum]|uniref:Fungal N-terminal domain-containing protein n=1 Tax=Fusarium oxysporum TaxID=5507 RepID=A0A2H3TX64_FUSOX|nr:uncharacterized protein FRV6_14449 [Fusarium oxysporum]
MAELALAIIPLGITVTSGLVKYLKTFNDHDDDRTRVVRQAERFESTFQSLEAALKRSQLNPELFISASEACASLGECQKALEELSTLQQKIFTTTTSAALTTPHARTKDKIKDGYKKFIYPLRKSDIETLEGALNKLSITLNIALGTLHLDEESSTRKILNEQMIEIQKNTIVNSNISTDIKELRQPISQIGSSLPVLQTSVDAIVPHFDQRFDQISYQHVQMQAQIKSLLDMAGPARYQDRLGTNQQLSYNHSEEQGNYLAAREIEPELPKELRSRRRQLQDLARNNLSITEFSKFTTLQEVPDIDAIEMDRFLRKKGIIGLGPLSTFADEDLPQQPWQDVGYYSRPIFFDLETPGDADLFVDCDFKIICADEDYCSSLDRARLNKSLPWIRSISPNYAIWLFDHQAPLWKWSYRFTSPMPSIFVLADILGMEDYKVPGQDKGSDRAERYLSESALVDNCSCLCSPDGCTPFTSRMKWLAHPHDRVEDLAHQDLATHFSSHAEIYGKSLNLSHHVIMMRQATFAALDLNHTCLDRPGYTGFLSHTKARFCLDPLTELEPDEIEFEILNVDVEAMNQLKEVVVMFQDFVLTGRQTTISSKSGSFDIDYSAFNEPSALGIDDLYYQRVLEFWKHIWANRIQADPLAGLDSIDWSQFSHAYGPADNVPRLLKDLQSTDPKVYKTAFDKCWSNIYHQGSRYSASVEAVPFLYALIDSPATKDHESLLYLIVSLAIDHPDWAIPNGIAIQNWEKGIAEIEKPEYRDRATQGFKAYQTVEQGLSSIVRFLDEDSASMRANAAHALAFFPLQSAASRVALLDLLSRETNNNVSATIILALAVLFARVDDDSEKRYVIGKIQEYHATSPVRKASDDIVG